MKTLKRTDLAVELQEDIENESEIKEGKYKKILVAALGNRAVTPDALGPFVVDNLYITRHLMKQNNSIIEYWYSSWFGSRKSS